MTPDIVEDDEMLYRRIPTGCHYTVANGKVQFSTSAFNSPELKPSVDRAKLRESARQTKIDPTDGVASLITVGVRAITSVENLEANGMRGAPPKYLIDVIARPIPMDQISQIENLAHAQIESHPEILTGSRFKKLKEARARLATERGWLIEPTGVP